MTLLSAAVEIVPGQTLERGRTEQHAAGRMGPLWKFGKGSVQ